MPDKDRSWAFTHGTKGIKKTQGLKSRRAGLRNSNSTGVQSALEDAITSTNTDSQASLTSSVPLISISPSSPIAIIDLGPEAEPESQVSRSSDLLKPAETETPSQIDTHWGPSAANGFPIKHADLADSEAHEPPSGEPESLAQASQLDYPDSEVDEHTNYGKHGDLIVVDLTNEPASLPPAAEECIIVSDSYPEASGQSRSEGTPRPIPASPAGGDEAEDDVKVKIENGTPEPFAFPEKLPSAVDALGVKVEQRSRAGSEEHSMHEVNDQSVEC